MSAAGGVESTTGAVAVGPEEWLFAGSFRTLPVPEFGPWLRFQSPLVKPDVRISRIRLSDKTSRCLSRATPSAASEHHLELIGFPISVSFATFCICLELRSLPSAGVTRFPRYY